MEAPAAATAARRRGVAAAGGGYAAVSAANHVDGEAEYAEDDQVEPAPVRVRAPAAAPVRQNVQGSPPRRRSSRGSPEEVAAAAAADEYGKYRSGGGENPFKAMQLALEAAPLSLRLVGMPISDEWQGSHEASPEMADPVANLRYGQSGISPFGLSAKLAGTIEGLTDFESVLRSSLDGLDPADGEMGNAAEDIAILEKRREIAAQIALAQAEERRKHASASKLAAGARGMATRRTLAYRSKSRVWKFEKLFERDFDMSGKNHTRLSIRDNEKLEIVSVTGAGRLLLTARDGTGETKVNGGVVYDSSAYAFQQIAPGVTIWSGAGDHDYELQVEPLEGVGPSRAKMTVKFRIEMTLYGSDVVSEPPLPVSHRSVVRSKALKDARHLAQLKRRSHGSSPTKSIMSLESRSPTQPIAPPALAAAPPASMQMAPAPAPQAMAPNLTINTQSLGDVVGEYDVVQMPQMMPQMLDLAAGGVPVDMNGMNGAYGRADEISRLQEQAALEREAVHMAQLDNRSNAQMVRVASYPGVIDPTPVLGRARKPAGGKERRASATNANGGLPQSQSAAAMGYYGYGIDPATAAYYGYSPGYAYGAQQGPPANMADAAAWQAAGWPQDAAQYYAAAAAAQQQQPQPQGQAQAQAGGAQKPRVRR